MRLRPAVLVVLVGFLSSLESAAACIPISEAGKHIGAHRCVTGKVVRVKQGNRGVHFFDFCEDYRTCPFTVVVFPGDLKQVGDIRQLQGKQIEIEGEVKSYDGRAEIVLQRLGQLRGDAARIPPLPQRVRRRASRQVQRGHVRPSQSSQELLKSEKAISPSESRRSQSASVTDRLSSSMLVRPSPFNLGTCDTVGNAESTAN